MTADSTDPPHADPIDLRVGQNLRLARELRGLPQRALGKAAGVTFQQIQKYERGTNRIAASTLARFCRVLDVPLTALFDGVDGVAVPGQSLPDLEPAVIAAARKFDRLTPKDRRSIATVIDGLLAKEEDRHE